MAARIIPERPATHISLSFHVLCWPESPNDFFIVMMPTVLKADATVTRTTPTTHRYFPMAEMYAAKLPR